MRRSIRRLPGRAFATAACAVGVSFLAAAGVAAQSAIPERLTLREAVALALERNPTMVAARAGVDAAEGDRLAASRRPNPALSVDSAGYPVFESVRPGYWGGQEFTVRFDQELETAGRRRLRTEVAELGRATAQLRVQDRARQIGLDVRRAYLAAVLAQTHAAPHWDNWSALRDEYDALFPA